MHFYFSFLSRVYLEPAVCPTWLPGTVCGNCVSPTWRQREDRLGCPEVKGSSENGGAGAPGVQCGPLFPREAPSHRIFEVLQGQERESWDEKHACAQGWEALCHRLVWEGLAHTTCHSNSSPYPHLAPYGLRVAVRHCPGPDTWL